MEFLIINLCIKKKTVPWLDKVHESDYNLGNYTFFSVHLCTFTQVFYFLQVYIIFIPHMIGLKHT